MKKYDLYLFDFDGTLVDSFKSLGEVFIRSFDAIGIDIDKNNIPRYCRIPLSETYKEVGGKEEDTAKFVEMIETYIEDEELTRLVEIFEDTRELIKLSKENNFKIGIVTSNTSKHVRDVLNIHGINSDDFSVIVGNKEAHGVKPNPAPVLKALDLSGFMNDKDRVCYVGDSFNDVKAGLNAGVDGILIDRHREFNCIDAYPKIKKLTDLFN